MFLTAEEMKTHLYAENVELIDRNDDTLLTSAIDGAIAESKGYLGAYDRDTIFDATGTDRNALLLIFVKDMTVWHFINLCNAGAELELRQARYERAIDWHKAVQSGKVTPDLPRLVSDDTISSTGGLITYGSNPQRSNHF